MKYMLQVRFNNAHAELAKLSKSDQQLVFDEYIAFREHPAVLDGNRLQPPDTTTTVTVHNGTKHTSHGALPAAAQIDGYYVIEAEHLDAATVLAAQIPAARMGGTIEIRATLG